MIRSFADKNSKELFNAGRSRKLPQGIQRQALRKLLVIDASTDLQDLAIPPANRLEKLSGKRQGQYSIRINEQWRICFRWNKGDAYNVEIIDYH